MKTTATLILAITLGVSAISTKPVSANVWISGLSRGQNLLLQRGLQIQASCYQITEPFNLTNWAASRFTTVHFWGDYPAAYLPSSSQLPWAVASSVAANLAPSLSPYADSLVSYQMGDEQNVSDAAAQADLKQAMASFHTNRPNVITYTNQYGTQISVAAMQTYMQNVRPDMLMFDTYPFGGALTGGSPTGFYADLQKYRKLGLAGNDGSGSQSIPVGFWTQACDVNHTISESEIRLNNFSGWTFGCKVAAAFLYQNPTATRILFNDPGTENPNPQFYQVAETNRQSLNLGSALVRLLSTDVRMKMGRHTATNWLGQKYGKTNDLPEGVSPWNAGADPYITGISVTNLGATNDGREGDVLVGYFKPLDATLTNAGHENDLYFMIVNGLSDADGSAADCRQQIHLTFDFGTSGIDSLLRLSRETGLVETVNLVHGSGSQYSLDLYLDGGTGDLFKFNNGGMFVIPEPGSMSLLGISLGLLATWQLRPRTKRCVRN
jgi:hypothetical protein